MEITLRDVVFICFIYFGFVIGQDFNVLDYGAKGDGETDDSMAFVKAWEAMCGDEGDTKTLIIPSGQTFLLQPLEFVGPCGSSPIFQMDGEIVAPSDKSEWLTPKYQIWISFLNINDLTIIGSGTINGYGSSFWEEKIANRPTALAFHHCNNLKISGITSRDSPRNHITINSCNTVVISNIQIYAPEDSSNTDGINISASTNVDISKSTIGTGDDCIAINTGSINVNITEIMCGPGHGISIGSLGANGQEGEVESVYVSYCTFNKTANGARIKTWAGGEGYVKHVYFEHITLIDTQNPIIIDQQYKDRGNKGRSSKVNSQAVAISDIQFNDFHGTATNTKAITLNCSKIKPCKNIVTSGIDITTSDGEKPIVNCNNVVGNPKCFKT